MEQHNTAIVSSKAQIGKNVTIGPFTIIEDDVEIGDNTEIRSSVVIANGSRIGNNCVIFPSAVIGTEPQDLKFDGRKTLAIIGDRTIIREFVTIHRGTHATGMTTVGSDCLIMAYCHIAHDCHVGDNVIMSNVAQIAGHVTIEEWAILGAFAKVHQFCSIGCHSMIGGDVKVVKDVAPYTLIGREPPKVEGINKIGLRRRGFSDTQIKEIESFYNFILNSGLNNRDGISKYVENNSISPEIKHCIEFIELSSRGIYR